MPFQRSASLLKIAVLLALLLLAACSSNGHKRTTLDTMPVEQLYQRAHKIAQAGNWATAATVYQKLISRFPYGPYNEQSQVELAYAQYKDNKQDDAYSTINEFIRTYPTHADIAYAYYLRGLINFDRISSGFQRFAGISPSVFDQAFALQSFDDLNTLIQRFPTSRFAADARQRMIFLRNQLAQSELNDAEYYLKRKAYIAAAHRAKYILEHYERAPQATDALAVLAKSYQLLGQTQLAEQTREALKLNDPEHPYLRNPNRWPKHHTWVYRLIPLTSAH